MSETKRTFVLEKCTDWARIRLRLESHLDFLPNQQSWQVVVEPYVKKRTIEQNAFLWGVVYPEILKQGELSGQLEGWDSQDLHDYFLGEFTGWLERVLKMRVVDKETGELKTITRKRLTAIKRSSKMNTKEFNKYWRFIQRRMASIGIQIPDPNENLQVEET